MRIDRNNNRAPAGIRYWRGAERRPLVSTNPIGIGHLPRGITNADGVSPAAFRDAAKSGLRLAWLEDEARASHRDNSRRKPPNETAAWNDRRQAGRSFLYELINVLSYGFGLRGFAAFHNDVSSFLGWQGSSLRTAFLLCGFNV
jgi:hypothetical protein